MSSKKIDTIKHHSITWLWFMLAILGFGFLGYSVVTGMIKVPKSITMSSLQMVQTEKSAPAPLKKAPLLRSAPSPEKGPDTQEQLDKLEVANAWSELILGGIEKLFAIVAGIIGAWQFLSRMKGKKET